MKIRSFLAFELPLDIRTVVSRVSGEIRESTLDVRWITVDNIHLTVVFIGNIKAGDIPAIGTKIKKICLDYGPFGVSLKALGCFPNKRNPKVVWLGLDGEMESLSPFRDDLQKELNPFGVKQEKRRFKPHLTIGRMRKSYGRDSTLDELILKYRDLTSPVCSLNELILFKSDLKPGGAEYTKVESWPLLGKAD